jgi:hypothetical protein
VQDLEKDLSKLKFAQPPKWLKARALVAAHNAYGGVARRRKYFTIAAAVAACVMIALVVSFQFLGAFGLLARGAGSPIHATGVESFGTPGDLSGTDAINEIRSRIEQPQGSATAVAEGKAATPRMESTAPVVESSAS